MARTTLQNTLSELYGLLASDANGTPRASLSSAGCSKVYPHEPGAGGVILPCSVTIHPAGIEPTEWPIGVRVYAQDQHPERTQDLLIDVPVAVSALLRDGTGYGPDRWEFDAIETNNGLLWIAMCLLAVGREDGF